MKPGQRKHGPEQEVAADSVEGAEVVDADAAPEAVGSAIATKKIEEAQRLRLFSLFWNFY